MPVDYGTQVVGNPVLRDRLERFSLQLGSTVRVLRGDMAEPPARPVDRVVTTAPPPAQRKGCLGRFFPVKPAAPVRRTPPDPRYEEWRMQGESRHLEGLAADITVDGLTTREVSEAAARAGLFNGVGYYDQPFPHTHVDIDSPPAYDLDDAPGPDFVIINQPPVIITEPPRLWVIDNSGGPPMGWTDPGAPFDPGGPVGDS